MLSGKPTHNRPIALLILIALFLVLAPTTRAQTKTFDWTNWDIDMVLQPDGSMEVTETQTLDFQGAPFTFGFRSIPVGSRGNNDGISNISVREGDQGFRESSSNAPGTFEVINDGGETRINWYFEPALGEHTYTFAYTVHGAVRSGAAEEGSGDQIFWTVIPSDHPATVNRSRATITLPEGIAPQRLIDTNEHLVAAYFNEVATDSVLITVSEDERVITYEANVPLTPGNSFDVRVQFPTGLLAAAAPEWQGAEQRSDARRRTQSPVKLSQGRDGLRREQVVALNGDQDVGIVGPKIGEQPLQTRKIFAAAAKDGARLFVILQVS